MPETILGIGEQFVSRLQGLVNKIAANAGYLLWDVLIAILILLAAKGLLSLLSKFTSRLMASEKYHRSESQGKRMDTILTLIRSVARYVIYFAAILCILFQFDMGYPVQALLGAAGIGSLAIGFGAKNLVQDVVTGFFMMFENQFSVGDYIKTDEAEGYVQATAMRVTYLRTIKGDQVIIPNGTITRVINYTRGNSVANITVSTAYEADTRSVIEVIREAVQDYAQAHPELVVEPPVVLGVTNFGDSSVDIGVTCRTHPMKHWETERGLRLAIKEKFDALGVEFPYPHMVTVPYQPPTQREPVPLFDRSQDTAVPDWAAGPDDDD